MKFILILLFWLPFFGPLIAGIIGGRKAGGLGSAIIAVFLPAALFALIIFSFTSSFSNAPLLGAVVAGSTFMVSLVGIGPLLLGAIIGGAQAPKQHEPNAQIYVNDARNSHSIPEKERLPQIKEITTSESNISDFKGVNDMGTVDKKNDSDPFRSSSNVNTKSQHMDQEDQYKTFVVPRGDNTILIKESYFNLTPIPGSLIIMNGIQSGKRLKLFGINDGSKVKLTIGRESVSWTNIVPEDMHDAHLRIVDSTKTVSRLQAELLYFNEMVFIRNRSNVNPIIINNNPVHIDSMIQIKHGYIIKAGYMMFRYELV